MQDVITYEMLYEILREEKTKKELSKLSPDFFKNILNYIEEKKAILDSQQKKAGIFSLSESVKTKKQLENIQKILKELYERRENKILQLALFQSRTNEIADTSFFLEIEKAFFNDLLGSLDNYRNAILISLLSNKEPKIEHKEEAKELKTQSRQDGIKLVRILNAIPRFVGDDLNVYGPFEEEYIASLPEKVADILIKKNKATLI